MAVTFNPGCVEAYNNLGVILREQGNVERALGCYQAALQLRPNFPQGLNNLAVVLTAQVPPPPPRPPFPLDIADACPKKLIRAH